MLEIPILWDVGQLALQVPRKAMERAAKLLDAAPGRAQQGAPMQTRIDIGPDLVSRRAYHNQTVMHDFIDEMIANIGELFDAARQLPGLALDFLNFLIMLVF